MKVIALVAGHGLETGNVVKASLLVVGDPDVRKWGGWEVKRETTALDASGPDRALSPAHACKCARLRCKSAGMRLSAPPPPPPPNTKGVSTNVHDVTGTHMYNH